MDWQFQMNTMEHIAMHGRDSNDHKATIRRPFRRAQPLCVYYPWVMGAIQPPAGDSETHWSLRGLPLIRWVSLTTAILLFVVCVPKTPGSGLDGGAFIYIHGLHSSWGRGTDVSARVLISYLCPYKEKSIGVQVWREGDGPMCPGQPYVRGTRGCMVGFTEGEAVLTDH